jgi:hypothetical protein
MLLNQMLPQAQFEELGRNGNPPNVIFTVKRAFPHVFVFVFSKHHYMCY